MADIVLRNLEDDLKEKLRLRAASNQRSMNAELREIVSAALAQPRRSSRADLKKLAADIRALSAGRRQTPSEALLRETEFFRRKRLRWPALLTRHVGLWDGQFLNRKQRLASHAIEHEEVAHLGRLHDAIDLLAVAFERREHRRRG